MFLTVKEASRILQMELHQVYYLLVMGEIESVKIGKAWRLVPEAVNDYVKRHPEKKDREPSGYFIYPGNSGHLFCCLLDYIPTDKITKASGVEGRGRRMVHSPGRTDRVLLQKLKPLTQLDLFSA